MGTLEVLLAVGESGAKRQELMLSHQVPSVDLA